MSMSEPVPATGRSFEGLAPEAVRHQEPASAKPEIIVRDFPVVAARQSHAAKETTQVNLYDRDSGGDG